MGCRVTPKPYEVVGGNGRPMLCIDVEDSEDPIGDVVDYANSMNSSSRVTYVAGVSHRDFFDAANIAFEEDIPCDKVARVSVGNGDVRVVPSNVSFAGIILEWGKSLPNGDRFVWSAAKPEPTPPLVESTWVDPHYSPDGLAYDYAAEDYELDYEEINEYKARLSEGTKEYAYHRDGAPPLIVRMPVENDSGVYVDWVEDKYNLNKWMGKKGESPFYMADSISPLPGNPSAGFIDRTRFMVGGYAGRYCDAGRANKTSGPERRMVAGLEALGVPFIRDKCRIAVRKFCCKKGTRWFPKGTVIHGYFIDVDAPLLFARSDGRRLAVEYDGAAYHGGAESVDVDEERDAALSRVGVDVIRVREKGLAPLYSAWDNILLRGAGTSESELHKIFDSIAEWYLEAGSDMATAIEDGTPERIIPSDEVFHYMPRGARPGAEPDKQGLGTPKGSTLGGRSYSVDATGDGITIPEGRMVVAPGGGDALRAMFTTLAAATKPTENGGGAEPKEKPMPRVVRRGNRRGTVL